LFAPKLDPITDVVEADDLFVGMISLSHNAEALHIVARLGQLFDSSFRSIVIREHSDDRVHFFSSDRPFLFVCGFTEPFMPGWRQKGSFNIALNEI
jgi:hypothetical protein